MKYSLPILECVPNFSEGRDQSKINSIAAAIRSVPGVSLLHIDISAAANRTVMTFAGNPAAVLEAAYQAVKTAAEVIDMQRQEGVHPRVGATDVCPLIPLAGIDMDDAIEYAKQLGDRVGRELNIPVYLYEYAASKDYRRALPDIRKGQYEGLAGKMQQPEWQPDYGPAAFNPATGATVIGARKILVAFNISLNTKDVTKAAYIAERIRESGYTVTVSGRKERVKGLLPKVRAIGWYMADFECAQISMNLLDYKVTSPIKVWEACRHLAAQCGIEIIGSEVIGLIPEACLVEAGTFDFMRKKENLPLDKQLIIHRAIELLGLKKVKPFDPQEKILEYALHHAGLL